MGNIVEHGLAYFVFRDDCADMKDMLMQTIGADLRNWIVEMVNRYKMLNVGHYPFPLSIRSNRARLEFYDGQYVIAVCFDYRSLQRSQDVDDESHSLVELRSKLVKDRISLAVGRFCRYTCICSSSGSSPIESCRDFLFSHRWSEGFRCPTCGHSRGVGARPAQHIRVCGLRPAALAAIGHHLRAVDRPG